MTQSHGQDDIKYEHIRRAVGQGLEALSLEAFDLEVAGDIFSVRGIPTRKESEKSPVIKLKAFKTAFLDICNPSKAPPRSATPAVKSPALLACCGWNLRKLTLINSNGRGRHVDQIGSAAHYRIACHKSYGLSAGMLTTRSASYIKSLRLVRH